MWSAIAKICPLALVHFVCLSLSSQADDVCSFLEADARNSVASYRRGGAIKGFMFLHVYNAFKCPLEKIGSTAPEIKIMSESAKSQTLQDIRNRIDDIDVAVDKLRDLKDDFADQNEYQKLSQTLLSTVASRHSAIANEIDSIENCPTKDFRSQLPKAWDQGDAPWCYAESAACAASFITGQSISVGDTASGFLTPEYLERSYRRVHKSFVIPLSEIPRPRATDLLNNSLLAPVLAAGEIQEALEFLVENGACAEDNWKNEVQEAVSGRNIWFQLMSEIEQNYQTIKSRRDPKAWEPYRRLFPTVDYESFVAISNSSSAQNVVRNLGSFACKKRISLGNVQFETVRKDDMTSLQLTRLIQEQLKSEHVVPIGTLMHAMIVAGQYLSLGGQCRFYIRNSWGPNCASDLYRKFPNAIHDSCHNGYFEVPATIFSHAEIENIVKYKSTN
jgi:hypothetical protein